jgi:hypothetical protein
VDLILKSESAEGRPASPFDSRLNIYTTATRTTAKPLQQIPIQLG